MRVNLPSQRELSVLLVVFVVAAAALVAFKSGRSDAIAGGGAVTTPASPTPQPSATDAQPPTIDSLPADTREQLDSLPPGTVLISCNPAVQHYPDGVIPEVSVAWSKAHPGYRVLLHGYCVDNPSLIQSFTPAIVP